MRFFDVGGKPMPGAQGRKTAAAAPAPLHRGADQPARRGLALDGVTVPGGDAPVEVRELSASAFHTLVSFRAPEAGPRPSVLVVPPLSGHFAMLMRDVVTGLLPDFDVALLDWTNVRHVARRCGSFGFEDNILTVERAIRELGPGLNVLALCQGGVPALAAAARLAEEAPALAPQALVLMAAPVDPMANPTAVVRLIRRWPMLWYRTGAVAPVPRGFAGQGRRVYPAATQLAGLQAYLARDRERGGELARKFRADDGADPQAAPFEDLYTSVMDVDARHFAENLEQVFHACAITRGWLTCRGRTVRPEALRETTLITAEGALDDIAAPGQTAAAHALCAGLPPHRRARIVVPDCGHFGLFHGRPWRERVLPELRPRLLQAG
jgi:poly(3-hydroxybutyrate) depolymerase